MKRIAKRVDAEPVKTTPAESAPAAPAPTTKTVDLESALQRSAETHATITAEALGELSGRLVAAQQSLASGVREALAQWGEKTPAKKPSEMQFDIQRDAANRIRGFKVTILR
jgi:hypothetical protein